MENANWLMTDDGQLRRYPDQPHRIESAGDILLAPGDVIGFTRDAIHAVEAVGDEPTVSFNLYGITDYKQRYQFHPEKQTAKRF